ncbi:sulfatase protein (plasmid) [Rhizobium phaseoli]|uniref:arylsulfatase n=1 Tax=Rhizobium phaseoli TaxID=396 RepID=UPI0007EB6A04|nr:arylsulfatase [Rhizobium phaseoli]ANL69875.1 sulfatase protein [Rhizobium phaseoli]ANL76311.1 sulfatase protein [Rhizobium phaseoli]ANL82667.1 sulfatase protein [Rhizobium phaseoli]PDS69807.1 arylsulfatase [Rhizobium phaseoli]
MSKEQSDKPINARPSHHIQGVGRREFLLTSASLLAGSTVVAKTLAPQSARAQANANRPNILVIFGDDIGYWNTSAYNRGMMGYRTPNIDRIAREGAIFTDLYAQQSCTAGRAAFITGQSCFRTGLLKVGLPGAKEGLSDKDPTLAELLKPQGYATGQFGKNHLGDRNEFLPTVHGFDEFFGNLYHLNAESEPENPDYPKDPKFRSMFGPRGVLHSFATDEDDPTEDPRFGRVGKQKIEDTGALTNKRQETVDEEFLAAAMGFIDKSAKAGKPFFCWFNSTRMHIYTHLKPESQGKTGLGIEADGMVEHDGMVGQLLNQLDELGIADNTIVVWTTDNGAEVFSWPDGGTTPFRGEKNENWEGGYRVPGVMRWPGVVKPGTEINEVFSHEDWVPTLVAAAGEPDITEKLLAGYEAVGKTFKVHLDGYDQHDLLAGSGPSKRKEYFYWTDDGNLAALRYEQWKIVFMEQRARGLDVWQDPLVTLRFPKLFNLRSDPFEIADQDAGDYDKWRVERAFVLVPAQAFVGKHLTTYQDFPPRQKPGSFSLDQVLAKLQEAGGH